MRIIFLMITLLLTTIMNAATMGKVEYQLPKTGVNWISLQHTSDYKAWGAFRHWDCPEVFFVSNKFPESTTTEIYDIGIWEKFYKQPGEIFSAKVLKKDSKSRLVEMVFERGIPTTDIEELEKNTLGNIKRVMWVRMFEGPKPVVVIYGIDNPEKIDNFQQVRKDVIKSLKKAKTVNN